MYEFWIVLFVGVFTIFVGLTKFGFNTRRAQRLIRLIGEGPARVFYVALGFILIVLAFFLNN